MDDIRDRLSPCFRINVHGVLSAELYTDSKVLLDIVDRYLGYFRSDKRGNVHLSAYYSHRLGIEDVLKGFGDRWRVRLGHGIYMVEDSSSIYQHVRGLGYEALYAAVEEQDGLHVGAFYNFNPLIRLFVGENLHKRYSTSFYVRIMRRLLHFPIFYLLGRNGVGVLHGSAVEREGVCFCFLGLNGVGKSSLAYRLVNEHGFRFLSDNFILTDGETIYSFPEDYAIINDRNRICERGVLKAVFILYSGSRETRIKEISKREATRKILRTLRVSEFSYGDFIELLNLLPSPIPSKSHNEIIEAMVSTKPCFDLYISNNYDEVDGKLVPFLQSMVE